MGGTYYGYGSGHPKTQEDKEIFVNCECNTEVLRVSKFEGETEVYLTIYQFASKKYTFWERLKIFFGGDIKTTEIILSRKNFEKLKEI